MTKAKITVVSGAARIYTGDLNRPGEVTPTQQGESVDVEGDWAVGSASTPGNPLPGTFQVCAVDEPLTVRWFQRAADASGNAAQSTDSVEVEIGAGALQEFDAHDSNAYTVSAGGPSKPD